MASFDQHDRDYLHIELRTDRDGEQKWLSLPKVTERELDALIPMLKRNGSTRIRVNGELRFFEVEAAVGGGVVRQWLVTAFAEFEFGDAAMVEADDEATAARLGAEILDGENACGECEDVEQVFVVPFDDRHAYVTRMSVERAPLDCCGGNAPSNISSSPHWATCPERPEGTGQPREQVAA